MLKDHVNGFMETVKHYLRENYREEVGGMDDALFDRFARMCATMLLNMRDVIDEDSLIRNHAAALKLTMRTIRVKAELSGMENECYRIMDIPMFLTLRQLCYAVLASFRADMTHFCNVKVKGNTFFCVEDESAAESSDRASVPMSEVILPMLDLKIGDKLKLHYNYGEDYMFDITVVGFPSLDHSPSMQDLKLRGGKGYGIWENAHELMDLYYNDRTQFRRKIDEMGFLTEDFPVDEKFNKKEIQKYMLAVFGVEFKEEEFEEWPDWLEFDPKMRA